MADSVKITTVVTSIAAQTVTVTNALGVPVALAIKDITAMPQAIPTQSCPVFAPRPDDFVSNVVVTRDTYGADAAYKTIEYDLAYVLYFYPMGEGLNWGSYYGAMVTAAAQILLFFAINTNGIAGQTDFLPGGVPKFAPQKDAAGTLFHGCEMVFHCKQYLET